MLESIKDTLVQIGSFFTMIADFFVNLFKQIQMIIEKVGDAAAFITDILDAGVDLIGAFIPAELLGWLIAAIVVIIAICIIEALP